MKKPFFCFLGLHKYVITKVTAKELNSCVRNESAKLGNFHTHSITETCTCKCGNQFLKNYHIKK